MATLVFCVCVGLGGCEKLNQVLGPSKQAPDEFTVYSRVPLAIPPDYGLHPPKPGAPRPQNLENRGRARAVVWDGLRRRRTCPGRWNKQARAFATF